MEPGKGAHLLRRSALLLCHRRQGQGQAGGRAMAAGRKCAAKCQPRTVVAAEGTSMYDIQSEKAIEIQGSAKYHSQVR